MEETIEKTTGNETENRKIVKDHPSWMVFFLNSFFEKKPCLVKVKKESRLSKKESRLL